MQYKLVPMDKSHLSQVAAIERMCFSHPWSEALLEQELYNDMISLVVAEGEDGQKDPQGGDPLAQADHGLVGEAEGEKAAEQAPQCHAQIEEGGPCGGLLGGDPPGHHHEAGGPEADGLLQPLVGEEGQQIGLDAGQPEEGQGAGGGGLLHAGAVDLGPGPPPEGEYR